MLSWISQNIYYIRRFSFYTRNQYSMVIIILFITVQINAEKIVDFPIMVTDIGEDL